MGDFERQYILFRYNQGLKWQTINGDYSAMYKFYRYVLDLGWNVKHSPRPRKERQSNYLAPKEIFYVTSSRPCAPNKVSYGKI